MSWLWRNIAGLCRGTRAVPGGDSACGFANTAMQKMLPEVLAAVIRAADLIGNIAAAACDLWSN